MGARAASGSQVCCTAAWLACLVVAAGADELWLVTELRRHHELREVLESGSFEELETLHDELRKQGMFGTDERATGLAVERFGFVVDQLELAREGWQLRHAILEAHERGSHAERGLSALQAHLLQLADDDPTRAEIEERVEELQTTRRWARQLAQDLARDQMSLQEERRRQTTDFAQADLESYLAPAEVERTAAVDVELALDGPLSVSFEDVPLQVALARMGVRAGVSMVAMPGSERPVSLEVEELVVRRVLDKLGLRHDLQWTVRFGAVIVQPAGVVPLPTHPPIIAHRARPDFQPRVTVHLVEASAADLAKRLEEVTGFTVRIGPEVPPQRVYSLTATLAVHDLIDVVAALFGCDWRFRGRILVFGSHPLPDHVLVPWLLRGEVALHGTSSLLVMRDRLERACRLPVRLAAGVDGRREATLDIAARPALVLDAVAEAYGVTWRFADGPTLILEEPEYDGE